MSAINFGRGRHKSRKVKRREADDKFRQVTAKRMDSRKQILTLEFDSEKYAEGDMVIDHEGNVWAITKVEESPQEES